MILTPLATRKIVFRNEIDLIPKTTYGTFSIYKYPAKFIPQVIAFVLREYGKKGMKVFDPFAGCGSVGLVSRIYGMNYELWDLNPLLKTIHDIAIMDIPNIGIFNLLNDMKESQRLYEPEWSNLNYWFPKEFLPLIEKSWGYVYNMDKGIREYFIIPLLKTTKHFSFADELTHKLYKSKWAKEKIKKLKNKNWKALYFKKLEDELKNLYNKIYEYKKLNPQNVNYNIKCGDDISNYELKENQDILITSPPYLQAQEYIRSTKLDLYFLGYNDKEIRKLGRNEIPYSDAKKIDIYSSIYYEYREKIKEKKLLKLYDRYFYSVLKSFQRTGKKINKYMFIFVGKATIRTIPIPIDEIIIQHLSNFGWEHHITLIDDIVSRVMFKTKSNPASNLKNERIKKERLIVLKRK